MFTCPRPPGTQPMIALADRNSRSVMPHSFISLPASRNRGIQRMVKLLTPPIMLDVIDIHFMPVLNFIMNIAPPAMA